MTQEIQNYHQLRLDGISRAKQYALYIALASVFMLFSALISAYVVRQSAGNWLEFPLPNYFYWSTLLILLSSITLELAKRSFKDLKMRIFRIWLLVSLVLGLGFVGLQYLGWLEMTSFGVLIDGNPSGSFVYVISGLHAAHVLGGIAAILAAIYHSFTLGDTISQDRLVRLNLTCRYWHFVDALWIYLLLFFLVTR